MFDTWAKLPSGVLRGNLNSPGSFSDCVSIRHESNVSSVGLIQGQHCMVNFAAKPDETEIEREGNFDWKEMWRSWLILRVITIHETHFLSEAKLHEKIVWTFVMDFACLLRVHQKRFSNTWVDIYHRLILMEAQQDVWQMIQFVSKPLTSLQCETRHLSNLLRLIFYFQRSFFLTWSAPHIEHNLWSHFDKMGA